MTSTQIQRRTSLPATAIRVLLVDGRALFRQAVRASLEDAPDIDVIGEAPDVSEARGQVVGLEPDVVLVDASGPQNGAAHTTALLKEWLPTCAVVVLGEEDPETLISVVEAGASGYVTQESALTDLIETTRSVHEGDTQIPPSMLGSLVSGLVARRREEHEAFERLSRLTQREREVLDLLAAGANKQAIAQALSISPETARTHVQNLLGKLQVHSRLEAAAFVQQARSLASPGSTS